MKKSTSIDITPAPMPHSSQRWLFRLCWDGSDPSCPTAGAWPPAAGRGRLQFDGVRSLGASHGVAASVGGLGAGWPGAQPPPGAGGRPPPRAVGAAGTKQAKLVGLAAQLVTVLVGERGAEGWVLHADPSMGPDCAVTDGRGKAPSHTSGQHLRFRPPTDLSCAAPPTHGRVATLRTGQSRLWSTGRSRPSWRARAAASRRLCTPSLARMLVTCTLAVLPLMNSC